MDTFQIQKLYNDIKNSNDFYTNYGQSFENYSEICLLLKQLTSALKENLNYSKNQTFNNNLVIYKKLISQNLNSRLNSIKLNVLHNEDVENLKKTLVQNIGSSIPVLELFPGSGQFLPYVLAAEPLYIADKFYEICENAADYLQNKFFKNRRLRKYSISEFNLTQLPSKSFGLIYCFNEFFYADIEHIYKYAVLVFDLLYEGGKFIFNFMPDDEIWSLEANDKLDFTAIDYKLLISRLEKFGYEIETVEIQPFRSSYIIVRKPGILQPRYKLGGSYAEIIDT